MRILANFFFVETNYSIHLREKRAAILRRHHWFPRVMTFEERAQKFHTDDVSLARSR